MNGKGEYIYHESSPLSYILILILSYIHITHPGQDKGPISCRHHSCQWYCTTTCHLLVPHLCRSRTLYPGTQRGSDKAPPQRFHQLQQCLAKQRHNINSKITSWQYSTVFRKCGSRHSPRLGQNPYFLSLSKLLVVAHQR